MALPKLTCKGSVYLVQYIVYKTVLALQYLFSIVCTLWFTLRSTCYVRLKIIIIVHLIVYDKMPVLYFQ